MRTLVFAIQFYIIILFLNKFFNLLSVLQMFISISNVFHEYILMKINLMLYIAKCFKKKKMDLIDV